MSKLFIVEYELFDWVLKIKSHNEGLHWDGISIPEDSDAVYHYSLKDRRVKSIRQDYFKIADIVVSKSFLKVFDLFGVNYKAPPIKLDLNGEIITDYFYYLLPCDFVSIVDLEKSEYVFDKERDTGEDMVWRDFPHIYVFEKIDKLVVNKAPKPDFFRAIEIGKYVCTERFKEEVERRKLKGVKFKEITDKFVYDPWHFTRY